MFHFSCLFCYLLSPSQDPVQYVHDSSEYLACACARQDDANVLLLCIERQPRV